MQVRHLFSSVLLCAPLVLSAPQPSGSGFGQGTPFILAARDTGLDWNAPRDDGGAFLAKRADAHSEEWFNSIERRNVSRTRDVDGSTLVERGSWKDLTGPNSMYSYPTCSSWGGSRRDLFYHDRDGNGCSHYFKDSGSTSWSVEENLGGSFDSSFAASCWGTGHISTYGKGTDGACWHSHYDSSSSSFSSWTSIGGNMVHEPSTVSWSSGTSHVFVTAASDGQCWHKTYSSSGYSSWSSIGGSFAVAPQSCSWGNGHVSVFATGTDGQCYHRMWLDSQGGWSSWQTLGGTLTGSVSSVAWGNRVDLFVRGTDNHCWYRRYHGDSNKWDDWYDLGGNLGYAPTVVQYQTTLEVYIVGSDKTMYRRKCTDDKWASSWDNYGGSLASQTTGVVWGSSNSVDVFAMGTDSSCQAFLS